MSHTYYQIQDRTLTTVCQDTDVPIRDAEFEALHRAALEATRSWSSAKASMALRATGLSSAEEDRQSLDAIAAEMGVSRETVRRARNELLHAMEPREGSSMNAVYASLSLSRPPEPSANSPATVRALRRLLTMTGPLPLDEVLSAWVRAGGKPPYSPLPADVASMRAWATEAGGFVVSRADSQRMPVSIAALSPEDLDQVSQFLLDALREHPSGLDRNVLLELAGEAGLKPATIATALSTHPAVIRVGRGRWALRGSRPSASNELIRLPAPKRRRRVRPTTFTWSVDGSLLIEFDIPRGPSPVIAVPKAVSALVEGREFAVEARRKGARIAVRNARLWGFGPLLEGLPLSAGTRVTISLDLLASTATITTLEEEERHDDDLEVRGRG